MCAFEVESARRPQPLRPAIPPLLWLAFGLWAATAALFSAGRNETASLAVATAAGVGLCAVSIATFLATHRPIIWMFVGVGLGVVLGCMGAAQMHAAADALAGSVRECAVELLGDASQGDYGYSAPVAVSTEGHRFKGRLTGLEEPLYCGQQLLGRFELSNPSQKATDFYWQNGFALRVSSDSYRIEEPLPPKGWLMKLRQRAIDGLMTSGVPGASLLAALACGWRGGIVAEGAYDQFKWSGTAHLVAVSGAHLALVVFALGALARRFGLGQRGRTAALSLTVAAYVIFSGMPISALRAAFMVVCAFLGALVKRRGASLNALGVCIALFIVMDPACALSISFALSAGSTLGILLFSQKITSWFWFVPERLSGVLVAPLALTLSSQLATLPLGCALFSQFSTVALPCNLVAAPLFAPAVIAALVSALVVALLPMASAVCWLAAFACAPLRWAIGLFSGLPGACLSVDISVLPALAISFALGILLYGFWRQATGAVVLTAAGGAALAAALAFAVVPFFAPPQLIMLDVGQGDALVVKSGGRCVLVDAGQEDQMLLSALARNNIRHLDAVIVTHSDKDHYGSLPALNPYVGVDVVYAHEGVLACDCDKCNQFLSAVAQLGCEVKGLVADDEIQVGSVRLTVVGPLRFCNEGGNEDSLCLLGTVPGSNGGWSFLLTGDAEAVPVADAVASAGIGKVNIIKVGHHGSEDALSAPLLDGIRPEVGFVSVGEDNGYGHPHRSTLEVLEDAQVQVMRTDLWGDVAAVFTDEGIELRPQHISGCE